MTDRLLVVTIGAILIALGAFAINDPAAVRVRIASVLTQMGVSLTDGSVRIVAILLVLLAAGWVVAAILVPPGPGHLLP